MITQQLDKQRAIFWGRFVQVAETMYVRGVTNPAQPVAFPDRWKLVRNINIEAVVEFVHQREFIGFVAESLRNPDDIAVILHGSETFLDLLDDLEFRRTAFTLIANGGETEYGFTRLYESICVVDPVGGASIPLTEYLKGFSESTGSVTVAGYSLGGALAILHASVLGEMGLPVTVYTFGAPMVGDATFVKTYNRLVANSHIIYNKPDIVPLLPGGFLGYEQANHSFEINSLNLKNIKRSIGCYHSLSTYLYTLGCTDSDIRSCEA